MLGQSCTARQHATPGATGRLLKGMWLANRYYIEDVIAVSKLSAIYRATTPNGQTVVIKEAGFRQWQPSDPQQACAVLQREAVTLRVMSEARVLAPRCLDLFHANGRTYLVMSYVPGKTLAVYAQQDWLTANEAIDIVRQVGYILVAVHRAGYVHQDVKPLNVQLCPNGMPMLLDFGAALPIGTITQGISGGMATFGYASAAQLRGYALPSNDVYALAALLDDLVPDLPRPVRRVVERATSDQPHTTMEAFLDELNSALEHSRAAARKSDSRHTMQAPAQRQPETGAVAINVLIIISLLIALTLVAVQLW